MSMLLFSLLNLRITKNAVNIGTYSLGAVNIYAQIYLQAPAE